MNSDDLMVGADAFLERRRQVVPGLEFARYHDDPFRQVAWMVAQLARWKDFNAGYVAREYYCPVAIPARLVRYVLTGYARTTASFAASDWLNRHEADDDLEVRGICPVLVIEMPGHFDVKARKYIK